MGSKKPYVILKGVLCGFVISCAEELALVLVGERREKRMLGCLVRKCLEALSGLPPTPHLGPEATPA